MNGYRAFILGPDGHVQSRVDLFCRDEADAREQAKALVNGADVELWELDKMLERFKGSGPPGQDGPVNKSG